MALLSTENFSTCYYYYNSAFTALSGPYNLNSADGFTMGGWFYVDDVTSFNNYLNFVRYPAGSSVQCAILVGNTSGKFNFFCNDAGGGAAMSGDLYDASNGWTHIVYRMGASATRSAGDTATWDVFINGTKNTINSAFDGGLLNGEWRSAWCFALLGAGGTSPSNGTGGRVDEYYYWNKALTDDQIYQMAAGYSFLFLNDPPDHAYSPGLGVRENATRFWPIEMGTNKAYDMASESHGLKVNGASGHAGGVGLIYPSRPQVLPFPAAAAPGGSYTIYNNYYRQLMAGNV